MQCSPSSLDSLAQGCRALATGDVLAGILALAHGGFFAADARAVFEVAEPMVVKVQVRPVRGSGRVGCIHNLHV